MQDRVPTVESQLAEFMPAVYGELRRLASHFLRRDGNQTLQPTALVHETYIELRSWKQAEFRSKAQFFGAASFVMRRVLATAGRRRRTLKRGGDVFPVPLTDAKPRAGDPLLDIVAVDIAMNRLEKLSPDASRVLELRLFGGLTIEETADFLEISPATVKRRWVAAHAWLMRELTLP